MSYPLASVTIGTGFTDRNGRIESCTEQMNCLLNGNLNMWSEIDPKTNHRMKYPGRPAAQVEEAFQFGSNCGIYSVFILVDASKNNRCRWRRDLAKEAFYAQSRVNMRRFACC